MTRLRAALAAALTVAATLAMPAVAAPGDEFVLRGDRSGWVDVTIPSRFGAVQLADARVESKGRFAGFYAEQLKSTRGEAFVGRAAGVVVLRDVVRANGQIRLGNTMELTPGVIRFYLIADGATTVTLRSSDDLPARTLRPARPTGASYATVPLTRRGVAWERTTRVVLPERAAAVVALTARGDALAAADPDVCLSNADPDCPEDTVGRVYEHLGGSVGMDATATWYRSYHSDGTALLPGRRVARFAVTPAAPELPVRQARGVAFVLTLR